MQNAKGGTRYPVPVCERRRHLRPTMRIALRLECVARERVHFAISLFAQRCPFQQTLLKEAHTSRREFARFLQYALASASEVEGHVRLARDLQFIDGADSTTLICRTVNVRRMLHGLLRAVKAKRDL